MNNLVVSGDYKNFCIRLSKETGELVLENNDNNIEISKNTINKFEVIHTEYGKNIIDVIARIIIGVYLIGYLGVIAGFTANNNYEIYRLVSVEFKDGKKSMIKMNKKHFRQLLEIVQ